MDFTLLQKIKFALSYNESIGHNIFLTFVYILAFVAILISLLMLRGSLSKKGFHIGSFFGMLAVFFWGVIFPMGLFLILTVSLQGVSSAKIIGDGVYFDYNKKQAIVVITDEYKANGSERGITYGSSKIYATAILPKSGETIWKKKLNKKSGQTPQIFQTNKTSIWLFDGSKLIVLNKKTGAITTTQQSLEKKIPELANKFPTLSSNYTTSGTKIIFKGLDGAIYQLDTTSKTGKQLPDKLASDYFSENNNQTTETSTSPIITVSKKKPLYGILLSAADIKKIQAKTADKQISQNSEERRNLYLTTLQKKGKISIADRKQISTSGFINGSFLLQQQNNNYQFQAPSAFKTYHKKPNLPDSTTYTDQNTYIRDYNKAIKKQATYLQQETTYTTFFNQFKRTKQKKQAPLLAANQLFILHNQTIETGSPLLLSAFDIQKRKINWTIPLGDSTITTYQLKNNYLSLFMGSGDPENILTIDINTGKSYGYNFHYNHSYKLNKSGNLY